MSGAFKGLSLTKALDPLGLFTKPKTEKPPAATPAPSTNDDVIEEARRKERQALQAGLGRGATDLTRGGVTGIGLGGGKTLTGQ